MTNDTCIKTIHMFQESTFYPDEEKLIVFSEIIARREREERWKNSSSRDETETNDNQAAFEAHEKIIQMDASLETSAPEVDYMQACRILRIDPLNPILFADSPNSVPLNT